MAQIAALLGTQRSVAKYDAFSGGRDTKTTLMIHDQSTTHDSSDPSLYVSPSSLKLDCIGNHQGRWSAEEWNQSQLDTARALEQNILVEKSEVFESRIVTKSPSPNSAACQETEVSDLFSGDRNGGVFSIGFVKQQRHHVQS